jgi:hypothetical protein
MPGRILTLQRQARELGRLRAGIYVPPANGKKGYPQRAKHWILTTHQRAYLDTAAELWGGQVEAWTPQGAKDHAWRLITETESLDGILPPGDPLSQSYEMWSRGGCQRRCDGGTEQISGKPCLCRAQFGEEFHLQPPEQACRPHTRLNVILPDLPDLGVWRMETKGYYAANEIAAGVDLIRHATQGEVAVPVRLRIEPRKRVAQGKTKQFPVIVVEIRGATAGQILAGQPATVALAGGERHAIGTGTTPALPAEASPDGVVARLLSLVPKARNSEQLRAIWDEARTAQVSSPDLKAAVEARAEELRRAAPSKEAVVDSAVEGDIEPDPNAVWTQVQAHVGKHLKWDADTLEHKVIGFLGKSSIDANGFELEKLLTALKNGEIR